MSFFIFFKNCDNKNGVLYRIAENQNDLNNLNIIVILVILGHFQMIQ